MCAHAGGPKNFGDAGAPAPWVVGRGWTPIYINLHFYLLTQETCFSFTRVTMPNNAKFSHSRSNHMSEIMEIHPKNWPLRRAFQRHSTSVELTRINRQPRTSYFIPFPRNTAILVKKNRTFFSPPVYLTSILREFPLEFCNGGSARKNWSMPLINGGKSYPYVHSFRYNTTACRTDRQADWQTDGFANTISRSARIVCWLVTKKTSISCSLYLKTQLTYCPAYSPLCNYGTAVSFSNICYSKNWNMQK